MLHCSETEILAGLPKSLHQALSVRFSERQPPAEFGFPSPFATRRDEQTHKNNDLAANSKLARHLH